MVSRFHSRNGTCGSGTAPADHPPDIKALLWEMLRQVPRGSVTTYGALADSLGDRGAARAIGSLLSKNPTPPDPPCHRVVYADGRTGWYKGKGKGAEEKISLLRNEGVDVREGHVDLEKHLFTDFQTIPVLKIMMAEQLALSKQIDFDGGPLPDTLSAIDVSYDGDTAFAARVDFSLSDGSEIGRECVRTTVEFPYIPGYLSFREAEAMRSLLMDDGRLHLIDGNGILHPRGAGIASHLGRDGHRTMGAAKSLLTGELVGRSIIIDGEERGRKVGKYYVSVGNRVTLSQAEEALTRLLDMGVDPSRRAHSEATRFKTSV